MRTYQRASLWSNSLKKSRWNSYMGSILEKRRVIRPSGMAFSLITALRNHYKWKTKTITKMRGKLAVEITSAFARFYNLC